MSQNLYTSGAYLEKNPLWHADESPWKVKYMLQILAKNRIGPKTICDVGCGTGEVLRLLQERMDEECTFLGYEISPQAFALCQSRANERLHFKLADIRQEDGSHFDLILLLDVLEHMEDYFSFLREIQPKSEYKIIHIPLDISVWDVLLGRLIRSRDNYGHIHYFTKEVALQMLKDVGYEVVDYLYTWQALSLVDYLYTWRAHSLHVWDENKRNPRKLRRKLVDFTASQILAVPKKILFAIHQDFAVRLLGGRRLLVLAR